MYICKKICVRGSLYSFGISLLEFRINWETTGLPYIITLQKAASKCFATYYIVPIVFCWSELHILQIKEEKLGYCSYILEFV